MVVGEIRVKQENTLREVHTALAERGVRVARELAQPGGARLVGGGRRAPARWPAGADSWGLEDERPPVHEDERTLRMERLHAASAEEGPAAEQNFAVSAFCVLARTFALQGCEARAGGMQAACGPAAFDALRADFGVTMEVFASPINTRYGRFCSAAAFCSPASALGLPASAVVAAAEVDALGVQRSSAWGTQSAAPQSQRW